jgi:hypothetical protein
VFGKRSTRSETAPPRRRRHAQPAAARAVPQADRLRHCLGRTRARSVRAGTPARAMLPPHMASSHGARKSYYETKGHVFGALIEAIDLASCASRCRSRAEEIRDIVNEIIAIKNIVMSISEQEELLDDNLQRRSRLRPARAAAGARRHRRHHGERLGTGLHRSQRARSRRPASASATISNSSTSASASSARSAGASTNPRRSATRVSLTARAST